MTIQQVLYVLEIASRSSVSQAAQKLYLSQSALSQQLRRLEEELGYALFSRTANGLQLTSEGKHFCGQMVRFLQIRAEAPRFRASAAASRPRLPRILQ